VSHLFAKAQCLYAGCRYASCINAVCHYAGCCYTECHTFCLNWVPLCCVTFLPYPQVLCAKSLYVECLYAGRRYTECYICLIKHSVFILNAVMLDAVMLSVTFFA